MNILLLMAASAFTNRRGRVFYAKNIWKSAGRGAIRSNGWILMSRRSGHERRKAKSTPGIPGCRRS